MSWNRRRNKPLLQDKKDRRRKWERCHGTPTSRGHEPCAVPPCASLPISSESSFSLSIHNQNTTHSIKFNRKGDERCTRKRWRKNVECTGAIRSDEKAPVSGGERKGEVVDQRLGARRRMAVDPGVGESQAVDLDYWPWVVLRCTTHCSESHRERGREGERVMEGLLNRWVGDSVT